MITLNVKVMPADDWSRPLLKNIENGNIYADVSCDLVESGFNIPGDWHTTTADWGEPISRIREEITFQLVK